MESGEDGKGGKRALLLWSLVVGGSPIVQKNGRRVLRRPVALVSPRALLFGAGAVKDRPPDLGGVLGGLSLSLSLF